MSGKQIRLQFSPKLFRVNSWIAQMIRQWIPDCWYGERKCTIPKVLRRTRETDSWWHLADRRRWRPGTWETSTQ